MGFFRAAEINNDPEIFICLNPAFLQGTPDQVAGDFEVGTVDSNAVHMTG